MEMEKSDRLELAEMYLRGCLQLLRDAQDGAGEVNEVLLMNAIESIEDFLS
jgi:hypothetical protein